MSQAKANNKTHEEVRAVTAEHSAALRSLPGVTGTFTGKKVTNGVPTGQLAVVVAVANKRPLADIPVEERIPPTVGGVPTDVIEEVFVPVLVTTRYDPLVGGGSTGKQDSGTTGTLGMIATDNVSNDPVALSCFHVYFHEASSGDPFIQPSPVDGGFNIEDTMSVVDRGVLSAKVDGGIALIRNRAVLGEIFDIGAVLGVISPSVSEAVTKHGRTSGTTTGTIEAIDFTGDVNYGGSIGLHTFTDVIRFTGAAGMILAGDSGSVLMDGTDAVGLVFASSAIDGSVALASPMPDVFSELDIRLYQAQNGITLVGTDAYTYTTTVPINQEVASSYLADFEVFGECSIEALDSTLIIGVGNPSVMDERLAYTVTFAGDDAGDGGVAFKLTTPEGSDTVGGQSFKIRDKITFRLTWNNVAHTLTCTAEQEDTGTFSLSLVVAGTPTITSQYYIVAAGSRTVDETIAEIFTIQGSRSCGDSGEHGNLMPGPWHVRQGTWDTSTGDFIEQTNSTGTPSTWATARIQYDQPLPLVGVADGPHSFTFGATWEGHHERDKWEIWFGAGADRDTPETDRWGNIIYGHNAGVFDAAHRFVSLNFNGASVATDHGTLSTLDPSDPWDISWVWDRATGDVVFTMSDQHSHSSTHTLSAPDTYDSFEDGLDLWFEIETSWYVDATAPIRWTFLDLQDDEA